MKIVASFLELVEQSGLQNPVGFIPLAGSSHLRLPLNSVFKLK